MEDIKQFFLKFFAVKHVFFQCLHAQGQGRCADAHPGQGPILGFLLHGEGKSQADIVREMKVSAATVAVSVARLEKLGLIIKERNQANQRANVLRLTEKGTETAKRMEQTMREMGQIALQGFTKEEYKNMESYCDRIVQNLQNYCLEKE